MFIIPLFQFERDRKHCTCFHFALLMPQGEPGSTISGGGLPGRKGEPGIPGIPVRNKLENRTLSRCFGCTKSFLYINQHLCCVLRVLQVVQAAMGPKVALEFQGHQVRMVAQVYQEHQDSPSRCAYSPAASLNVTF